MTEKQDVCTCKEPVLASDYFPDDPDDDTDYCVRCRRPVLAPEVDE